MTDAVFDFSVAGVPMAPLALTVAPSQAVRTFPGVGVEIVVDVFDPDGPVLGIVSRSPNFGFVATGTGGKFVYVPQAGFTGSDQLTVAFTDGTGARVEQVISIEIAPMPAADEFRLFAGSGYAGEMGGFGTITGTSGYQSIQVSNIPGMLAFDASFNRGGDLVQLGGSARQWRAMKLGSQVILSDGDTFVSVPIGPSGLVLSFDDGARLLKFEAATQAITLGTQVLNGQLAIVAAPAQIVLNPVIEDGTPTGRLFLNSDSYVWVGTNGTLKVTGTEGSQHVHVHFGRVELDASFNRGGDIIDFDQGIASFTALRFGSSVILNGEFVDAVIPFGTAGMNVGFADANRTLLYDQQVQALLMGTQVITFDPAPLLLM